MVRLLAFRFMGRFRCPWFCSGGLIKGGGSSFRGIGKGLIWETGEEMLWEMEEGMLSEIGEGMIWEMGEGMLSEIGEGMIWGLGVGLIKEVASVANAVDCSLGSDNGTVPAAPEG